MEKWGLRLCISQKMESPSYLEDGKKLISLHDLEAEKIKAHYTIIQAEEELDLDTLKASRALGYVP